MASGLITSWQMGKSGSSDRFSLLGLQNHCIWWLQPWNLKMLASWKESYDKSRQCIKKQRHHFVDKGLYSQSYGLSSCHVRMWEVGHKEGWALKNWSFWIVLENTLESPLDSREIKPVNLKGSQPWIFIVRTDAETPILWPPMWRDGSSEKAQMLGKIESRRRRRQNMRWLDGITDSMDMNLGESWGMVRDREAWHVTVYGVTELDRS